MPSLGKVSLNTLDWDNDYKRMITARARTVSRFAHNNVEIFDILCQFLLENSTKEDFNKNFHVWCTQIRFLNNTLKIDEMESFISALQVAYEDSRDRKEVSDFRGKLFEVIVENIYSKKYQDNRKKRSIFEKGCEIEINKKKIHYIDEDPDKTKKTVDIAGYNIDNGEFYEVKVGPSNFTDSVLKYLNILKCTVSEENISNNISVGCMTMDIKANLKQNLMKVKIVSKVDFNELQVMGREEVRKIIRDM